MALTEVDLARLNDNVFPATGSFGNRLINGDFSIAQRGTSFSGGTTNANDAYTLDRWYVLSEGSDTIDVSQETTEVPTGGKYSIALDVETTGEKFGIAQIIEGINCVGLIGNTATLSFKAKVSDARIDTVKAAIVSWSGTENTVTSDIISAWNADGTTPTLIANATFENTPADLGVTTSWATYSVTADIDTASTANVIVFIWSDDATNPTAGDFLYLADVQLEIGDTVTPFEHRPSGTELALCQRYFINYAATTSGSTGSFVHGTVNTGSSSGTETVWQGYIGISGKMRTDVPTVVLGGGASSLTLRIRSGGSAVTINSIVCASFEKGIFTITPASATNPDLIKQIRGNAADGWLGLDAEL